MSPRIRAVGISLRQHAQPWPRAQETLSVHRWALAMLSESVSRQLGGATHNSIQFSVLSDLTVRIEEHVDRWVPQIRLSPGSELFTKLSFDKSLNLLSTLCPQSLPNIPKRLSGRSQQGAFEALWQPDALNYGWNRVRACPSLVFHSVAISVRPEFPASWERDRFMAASFGIVLVYLHPSM